MGALTLLLEETEAVMAPAVELLEDDADVARVVETGGPTEVIVDEEGEEA